jgi:drug/metabolite transporter (DMT)-like permease
MERNMWLLWVAIAGLSWGTYVPLIAYGGKELGFNRFGALLCVGVAYFLIAVILPIVLFFTKIEPIPKWTTTGLIFASAAGVAGAVGALMVIFASKAAPPGSPSAFYIAPLIFGLAPVINTVVSVLWHPKAGDPFVFGVEMPGWKLWAGIIFVGVGAALVLLSKEELEAAHRTPPSPHTTAPALNVAGAAAVGAPGAVINTETGVKPEAPHGAP